eukprot:2534025-Prymnesium_polylepis.1
MQSWGARAAEQASPCGNGDAPLVIVAWHACEGTAPDVRTGASRTPEGDVGHIRWTNRAGAQTFERARLAGPPPRGVSPAVFTQKVAGGVRLHTEGREGGGGNAQRRTRGQTAPRAHVEAPSFADGAACTLRRRRSTRRERRGRS